MACKSDVRLRQQTEYPTISNPLRCYPTITSPQRKQSLLELSDRDGKPRSSQGKDTGNTGGRTLMRPPSLPPLNSNPLQLPSAPCRSPTWPESKNKKAQDHLQITETKKKSHKGPLQSRAQNWLTRFLGIKPATRVLCFQVSKLKARREVVAIWKEWRKFGMEGVVVDKVGGKVWASVGSGNGKSSCFSFRHLFILCPYHRSHIFPLS